MRVGDIRRGFLEGVVCALAKEGCGSIRGEDLLEEKGKNEGIFAVTLLCQDFFPFSSCIH